MVEPADWFVLSPVEADILGEALELDLRQFPLQLPRTGRTIEDRAEVAAIVSQDLQQRGLSRHGELSGSLRTALGLFRGWNVAIAANGTDAHGPLRGRAMADDTDAVVVTQDEHGLRFDLYRSPELVLGLLRVVSWLDAAPGESVTVDVPAVAGDDASADAPAAEPRYISAVRPHRTRTSAGDHALVEAQFGRTRTGGGYFVVIGRDAEGREVVAPGLSWLDTDQGRTMIRLRTADDGRTTGTFTPADNDRIARALVELVRASWGPAPRGHTDPAR